MDLFEPLTTTDNTIFALTTVSTVNTWSKSMILKGTVVNGGCYQRIVN